MRSQKKKRSRSDFGHHQSLWFCCMVSHWQLTKNSTKFSRSLQWAPRQFFFEWGKRELEGSLFWKIKEITKKWKIKIVRFSLFIYIFFWFTFCLNRQLFPFVVKNLWMFFRFLSFTFVFFDQTKKKQCLTKAEDLNFFA